MSYTDVYTEAVVISMFKEWHACDVLDETNQLTEENKDWLIA